MYTILCADAGTSSIKLALIEAGGEDAASFALTAFAREPYPRGSPPAVLESAFYAGIQKLFAARPVVDVAARRSAGGAVAAARPVEAAARPVVDAVCISACGPSLFPVTKEGETLTPLWWYSPANRRPALQSFFLPYILWQKQHLPDEYRLTDKYFSPQEYLSWKLGAAPAAVLPTDAYLPYYWDKPELALTGIPPERFFPYAPLGGRLGVVQAAAARRTGIPRGTPVAAGAVDFIMALRGAGIARPGMTLDRAGSSEGINVCLASPPPPSRARVLQERGLRLLPHAVSGRWNLSAVIPESGSLFDRYRAARGLTGCPYDVLLEALLPDTGESSAAPAALADTLPAASPDAAAALADTLPAAAVDEGRRVLETLAGKVSAALESLKEAGYPVTEMIISGGQAKSARWNRYKEERAGCRFIQPPIPDTELAGNALAALTALRS